jgi:hypothetical protein
MNKIFHADDTNFTKSVFNDAIVSDGNTLLVDFGESALVDELTDVFEVWVSPGNVWADPLEHLESSLVETDKGSAVDLGQTEKLEDLAGFRGDLVDTRWRVGIEIGSVFRE